MNSTPVKPWAQFEDEADLAESAASGSQALSSEPRAGYSSESRTSVSGAPGTSIRVRAIWALVPLGMAAAWLLLAAVSGFSQGGGISPWHAVFTIVLIVAAGAIVVVARRMRRAALQELRLAIGRTQGSSGSAVQASRLAGELGPLWEAVEGHSANSQRRLAELAEQNQQLMMELSLAGAQKRQIEAIINSIFEPILIVDNFDQLLLANPAAEDVFGFNAEESHRRPLCERVTDERLLKGIRQTREADSHSAKRRYEQEFGDRAFSIMLAPVESKAAADGAPPDHHGVVVVMRDITKEREASKSKSDFVAKVTHELRTPLSSICAYVEMLVDGEAEDEHTRKEYYDIIQGSADRLNRLIDNMLNISRIEAGTIRINREPMALCVVVQEAVEVARPQAEAKSISLTADLAPAVFRISADHDLIYQAVLNLLSNAIKYTNSGGQVTIKMTADEPNRLIHVQFRDTGVGIPPEDLPRMFQKFFRVEANKDVAKGTGLGLNLVKHVVETLHEGKMSLTSVVGEGSTFTMSLPMV